MRELIGAVARDLHAHFGESLALPLPVEMAHVTLPPGALRAALSEFTARVTGTPVMLTPERLHVLHFDSMGNYWPDQSLPLVPS